MYVLHLDVVGYIIWNLEMVSWTQQVVTPVKVYQRHFVFTCIEMGNNTNMDSSYREIGIYRNYFLEIIVDSIWEIFLCTISFYNIIVFMNVLKCLYNNPMHYFYVQANLCYIEFFIQHVSLTSSRLFGALHPIPSPIAYFPYFLAYTCYCGKTLTAWCTLLRCIVFVHCCMKKEEQQRWSPA